jgi:hypothetical protein
MLPKVDGFARESQRVNFRIVRDWRGGVVFAPLGARERSLQTVTSKVSTGVSKSLYQARPRTVVFSVAFASAGDFLPHILARSESILAQ